MDSSTNASAVPPERETKYLWLLAALILFSLTVPLHQELGIENQRYTMHFLMTAVLILGVRAACRGVARSLRRTLRGHRFHDRRHHLE